MEGPFGLRCDPMMINRISDVCPFNGKLWFQTAAKAKKFLRLMKDKPIKKMAVYQCRHCDGWHLFTRKAS